MILRSYFYRRLWKETYDKNKFKSLFNKGRIIDGRNGGLILGASHQYGGIYVYQFNTNHFINDAEIEGNEYYVNKYAFENNKERILEINSYYPNNLPKPQKICTQSDTQIIDASGYTKALFLAGGMVINSFATHKYIKELNSINKQFQKQWLGIDEIMAFGGEY
jgi:hypothetical protein